MPLRHQQEMSRHLVLLALVARTDDRAVGAHPFRDDMAPRRCEQTHCPTVLLSLLARADCCDAGDDLLHVGTALRRWQETQGRQ